MKIMNKRNILTAAQVIRYLKRFPPESEIHAYEGEVSGIIITHNKISGIIHNDGEFEIHDSKEGS